MTNNGEQGTIAEQIQQIICQQTGYEEELTPETDLLNDLAIDSLELVELGLVIAKSFGTKLPRGEVRQCITVGELTQLVKRVLAEAQEQPA